MSRPARICTVATAVVAWALVGCGGGETTDAAGPRPLSPSLYAAQAALFASLDSLAASGPALVYVGDSITDRMPVTELWRAGGDTRVINRAIAGDTVAGVTARVRAGFPAGARVCVLMIGINDLHRGAAPEATARAVTDLVRYLTEDRGVALLILESLLPSTEAQPGAVERVNALLACWAEGRQEVVFLDLARHFRRDELFCDGIHLTPAGVRLRLGQEAELLARRSPALDLRLAVRGDWLVE